MAPPVALITGASSGIGLALTKQLLERKWRVVMVDVNPPKEDLKNIFFLRCDVTSWDEQAATFRQAYERQGRLDFVALNAGIDDRDDIFNSISGDPSKPPREPNMKTIDVCFVAVYYGIKLAAHYLSLDSKAAGKPKAGGKIVITASAAGIYPNAVVPQYCGAKTGLVGLVRALAASSAANNIRLNAVCPALVRTSIAPQGLFDAFKEEQFTPMSTIMRVFSELADIDGVADEDWVENGKNGQTVEGNMEELIWHQAPQRPASSTYENQEGLKAWKRIYVERNKKWAQTDWKEESTWKGVNP